jgi:hypothetical protein
MTHVHEPSAAGTVCEKPDTEVPVVNPPQPESRRDGTLPQHHSNFCKNYRARQHD